MTDLLNEPAGDEVDDAEQWQVFDQLPPAARAIVANAGFDYCAVRMMQTYLQCSCRPDLFRKVVASIDRAEHGKAYPGLYPPVSA